MQELGFRASDLGLLEVGFRFQALWYKQSVQMKKGHVNGTGSFGWIYLKGGSLGRESVKMF